MHRHTVPNMVEAHFAALANAKMVKILKQNVARGRMGFIGTRWRAKCQLELRIKEKKLFQMTTH